METQVDHFTYILDAWDNSGLIWCVQVTNFYNYTVHCTIITGGNIPEIVIWLI